MCIVTTQKFLIIIMQHVHVHVEEAASSTAAQCHDTWHTCHYYCSNVSANKTPFSGALATYLAAFSNFRFFIR